MLDHVDFGTTNYEMSREFYVTCLAPLGIELVMEITRHTGLAGAGFGRNSEPQFWISEGSAIEGRLHIAFEAKTRNEVDAFYRASLEAGGKSKGEPGLRPRYGADYYAAFVFDPDGHTIEAICRGGE
ncbi:MAG: VOC family protein [Alphaproteobacteria bacterium]|nr:VOC family protein [Alphaproteobacteria bacterium]